MVVCITIHHNMDKIGSFSSLILRINLDISLSLLSIKELMVPKNKKSSKKKGKKSRNLFDYSQLED